MDKNEKRERIIEAGKKLIIQKGYRYTSVEDITKEAGISKGSFYTYFKSKDNFVLCVIESRISEYKIKVEELLELNLGFEETLKRYVIAAINKPLEDTEFFLLFRSIMNSVDSLGKDIREKLSDIKLSRNKGMLKILKKYKKEIDASNDEELIKLSKVIPNIFDIFFEKIFTPFRIEDEKNVIELKEKIKTMDMEKEIEFAYKLAIKILLKTA